MVFRASRAIDGDNVVVSSMMRGSAVEALASDPQGARAAD